MITRATAAEIYTLAMTAYRHDLAPEELRAWARLLQAAPDIDDDTALAAVTRLCLRPGQFPPTPGDVVAEARAATGPPVPPSMDAAIGHYLAGNWDTHPAVAEAAAAVWWDRRTAEPQAVRQFRQFYAAATETPARRALDAGASGPVPLTDTCNRVVAELERTT